MLLSCWNYHSQSQIGFCSSHSFFAPHEQQGILHPVKSFLQLAKNVLFQTGTFSEFWAVKKPHLICSLILSWAKAHVRLCHLWAGSTASDKRAQYTGEKCLPSSMITRLTDEIGLSRKRLLNGFLTQKWVVYGPSFRGERNHGFYNERGNFKK